jgi:energy-converting hydrogenase Eha subunit A
MDRHAISWDTSAIIAATVLAAGMTVLSSFIEQRTLPGNLHGIIKSLTSGELPPG